MSQKPELSHRQEKEKEKDQHAHSTPPRYLSSKNPAGWIVVGVILIGAVVLGWIFLFPPLWGMD